MDKLDSAEDDKSVLALPVIHNGTDVIWGCNSFWGCDSRTQPLMSCGAMNSINEVR